MANLSPFAPGGDPEISRARGRILISAVILTSAASWFALWRWGSSPAAQYGRAHVHFAAESQGDLLIAFVAGWVVMLVAMMLPTSLPLLALFSRLARERRDHWVLVSLVIAGYIGVWLIFGFAAYLAGDPLLRALSLEHWAYMNGKWIAAATLLIAGIYQFTPLKYRCLDKCRSPFSFVTGHWTGRNEKRQALWLGAHHGIFCVGCCWSLMLLMFTIGAGSVGWMFALGALMAIEKNLPWGKHFARGLGFALLVAACSVPLGFWPG